MRVGGQGCPPGEGPSGLFCSAEGGPCSLGVVKEMMMVVMMMMMFRMMVMIRLMVIIMMVMMVMMLTLINNYGDGDDDAD